MRIDIVALGKLSEEIGELLDAEIKIKANINGTDVHLTMTEIPDADTDSRIQKKWPREQISSLSAGNSDGKQWLYLGKVKNANTPYINIGKYYACTFNKNEKVFWIGVESMEDEGTYVCLFIDENQIKPPRPVCKEVAKNGAYVIKTDDFSFVRKTTYEKELLLEKKLKEFLADIFK